MDRILIIDDDPMVFQGHKRLLATSGYKVEQSVTGETGFETSMRFQPHLILLDILLPDMDGFEVCRRIRSEIKDNAPYILMISAAMTEPKSFITGFEAGADDYISKPIIKEVLLARTKAIFRAIKAERSLALEKEKLYTTLKSIGDGVITTDIHGNINMLNDSAENLTGWSHEEACGKHLEEVFHIINEMTRIRCDNPVEKALKTGKIVGLANNTLLIARDGTERIITDSGAPIFDGNKKIIGVVIVFQNITERVKLENQIQQSQKMESIGTLAGGIAHDFNNIIGVITGNVSYARGLLTKKNELDEVLLDVEAGAKQAQTLTHQLLTFSKGGAPIVKEISIGQFIYETVSLVVRGSHVHCDFSIDKQLWPVKVDKGQIGQVVTNLMINAKEAMPDGGEITIRAENVMISDETIPLSPGQYVKITIQDNGIGIKNEHVLKVFDPYFSTKQQGSGLGLATSYSIIKKHGGHISVESKLGKGTTFMFYLPAVESREKKIEQMNEPQHKGCGKILIMDDDEAILNMLRRILKRMGYETALAKNGTQAIELYQKAYQSQQKYDLVILDLTVPGGLGGAKTIPELLKIDSKAKVVVSSGYSNDPIMANYEDYGFCAIIPKPYTQNQITELFNKVLGGCK
jgi:PAS domain S-box-containing protein